MKNIVAGVFHNTHDYKKLENSLLDSGLADKDFMLYLNPENEHYLASVHVKNDAEKIAAREIFISHKVVNSYYFEGISEHNTYEELKELIAKVAHSEIAEAQELNIKKSTDGINDEVVFGK
ncbi:MAG: hypothetical protein JSS94_00460 [Bacteroidetes bacterium]|nr:hypothetical protein [Bacteroidota bacterium]